MWELSFVKRRIYHACIYSTQLVNTVFPLLINFTMEGSLNVDSFDKSLLLTLILDKFHDGTFTLKKSLVNLPLQIFTLKFSLIN